MAAYIILISLVTLLLVIDHSAYGNKKGFFSYVAITIVIFFVLLRENVGYDYRSYLGFLLQEPSRLLEDNMEIGFVFIVYLLRNFDLGPFFLFAFFGVSILLLLCRGINLYTKNFSVAFLIYLLIPGLFLNSLSILRQALAIVLLFNGYYYYFRKQYGTFGIFYLLAFSFHYSSIFVLPFFLLSSRIDNKISLLLLIGIPASLFLNQINFSDILITRLLGDTKYVAYGEYSDGGASTLKLLILNASVFIYYSFLRRYNNLNKRMYALVIFGVILINVFSSIGALTRISYYFKIFEIPLLANTITMVHRPNYRLVFYVGVFLYFFLQFYNALYIDTIVDQTPKLTPYNTLV